MSARTPITGASFILNDSRAKTGRLAMVVSLPQPQTFRAGENTVVNLTFQVTSKTTTRSTALSFHNEITRGALVDTRAAGLPLAFTNGTVMIHKRK